MEAVLKIHQKMERILNTKRSLKLVSSDLHHRLKPNLLKLMDLSPLSSKFYEKVGLKSLIAVLRKSR